MSTSPKQQLGRQRLFRHGHQYGLLKRFGFHVLPTKIRLGTGYVLLLVVVATLLFLHCRFWMRDYFLHRMMTSTPTTYNLHPDQADFAIFYHIFIPQISQASNAGNDKSQANALRIIDEQMHQIGKSYAASDPKRPAKLYYNTVGAANIITESFMAKYCGPKGLYNLDCEHLHHADNSLETMTLENVYEYCHQAPSNIDADQRRVVYLHNKGSFHENPINEQWRPLMTYSVTTEQCLHPPTVSSNLNDNQQQCNVCGLYFAGERGLFMPGNFWTAQCDYVSRLLPPLEFEKQSTEVLKDVLLMHLEHRFEMDLYNFVEDNYGVGRYADELWIGSHPSIQPCDWSLHKRKSFGFGHGDAFFEWLLGIWDPFQTTWKTMDWTMSPNLPMKLPIELREDRWWYFWETNKVKQRRLSKRLCEFTMLGGNLFKWIRLYGEVPPPSSWIWSWFPDGDFWKKALEVHGNTAVEKVTQERKDMDHAEFMDPIYTLGYLRATNLQLWWVRQFGGGIL